MLLFLFVPKSALGQKQESVLWEIQGNGLPAKSYLFGTFHTAPYTIVDSFPALKSIMQKCNFGIFEQGGSDIGIVKDTVVNSPSLDEVFTKSEYALVDSFFTSTSFGSIKPHNNDASLEMMLQVVLMLKKGELDQKEMFFDDYFKTFMNDSLGKSIFQLDEPIEMAKLNAATNYRQLAKAIVYLIKNDFNLQELYPSTHLNESLFISSLQQDLKLNEEPENETIRELTVGRNLIWLPKIIDKMMEGPCFIAVGLRHLGYKTGLINLLQQKGYQLKPMVLKKNYL